jgi:hypothetical protein
LGEEILDEFKEPILSKDYVGYTIYRFLWLRSFHQPVVFTLHNQDGQIWLITKMLDRQPRCYDDRIGGISEEDKAEYIKKGYLVDKKESGLMARIADRKANITYNNNIAVSCISGLRYGGTNEKILKRMYELGLRTECDHRPIGNYTTIIRNKVIFSYGGNIIQLANTITTELLLQRKHISTKIIDLYHQQKRLF